MLKDIVSQYSHSIEVEAPADEVFAFVSKPENMPKYLPTLEEAHMEDSDRVVIDGNAEGHAYHADGDLHLDPDERTMHWGSDSMHKYRGQLHVTGDQQRSTVSVKLTFEPGEQTEEKIKDTHLDGEARIQQGLEEALSSIKKICEKSEAATDQGSGYLA